MPGGRTETLTAAMRAKVTAENERIASQGMRVLAFAQREFDPASFDPSGDLMALMQDLEMAALVGEVDPPRAEATKAIAAGQARRHPGPDDHRRPRRHRRGDRPASWASRGGR